MEIKTKYRVGQIVRFKHGDRDEYAPLDHLEIKIYSGSVSITCFMRCKAGFLLGLNEGHVHKVNESQVKNSTQVKQ